MLFSTAESLNVYFSSFELLPCKTIRETLCVRCCIQQKIISFSVLPQNLTSNESSLVKCKMFAYITNQWTDRFNTFTKMKLPTKLGSSHLIFRTSRTIKHHLRLKPRKQDGFIVKRKTKETKLFFFGGLREVEKIMVSSQVSENTE